MTARRDGEGAYIPIRAEGCGGRRGEEDRGVWGVGGGTLPPDEDRGVWG